MKLDDIETFYEIRKTEQQRSDAEFYALEKFIEVMKKADKIYSKLLSDIAYYKRKLTEENCSTKEYYQKELDKLKAKKDIGFIQIEFEEKIKISWWDYGKDTGELAAGVLQRNHNWEKELELFEIRQAVLHNFCITQRIDHKMTVEKIQSYTQSPDYVKLSSEFQVPISRIENTQQIDVELIKGALKAGSSHFHLLKLVPPIHPS